MRLAASTCATNRVSVPNRTVRRTRPHWLPTVAAVAGIALTAAAGNWQLDRAHEKERLQQAYDRGVAEAAVILSTAPVEAQSLLFRHIEATGEFVPRAAVLLDNKVLSEAEAERSVAVARAATFVR